MKFKTVMTAMSLIAGAAFLSACGGSGGGSSGTPEATATPVATSSPTTTPAATPEPTATPVATSAPTMAPTPAPGTAMVGKFIDSPVEGLYYETATKSGYTNASGEFNYKQGETVKFKLYGTWLNTQSASVILTPADAENVSIDYSVNLLRLLQTLDMDNDPSNGIKLPTLANGGLGQLSDTVMQNKVINFEQDIYTFETDMTVRESLLTLTWNNQTQTSKTSLVPIKDALAHFNASITGADTGEIILDVSGKKVSMVASDSRCMTGTGVNTKPTTYEFTDTTVTETMYESSAWGAGTTTAIGTGNCKITDFSATPSVKTSVMGNMGNTMNTFYHGPKFSYKNMNRIGIRSSTVDPASVNNGLESIVVIWHTPGTKKITYQRRYIKTEGVADTVTRYSLTWTYTWE